MCEFLEPIANGETLTQEQAEAAMHRMMQGDATAEAMAALLLGLRARGEALDELVGFARAMRAHAITVPLDDPHAIDLCGTGGDAKGTFNISTAASFVCAGAGVTVAKHGNRSITSKSGSADVLEALGAEVNLGADGVAFCLREVGLGFMFAPLFHPAMKHVMPVRRALGVRTAFNILGPLCNPAGVTRQLVGAFRDELAALICGILAELGADHVVTVHGRDGLDEFTLSTASAAFEYKRGLHSRLSEPSDPRSTVRPFEVVPEMHGLGRFPLTAVAGGTAEDNAGILRSILDGQMGAYRAVTVLNSSYALHTSGRFDSLRACFDAARQSIDSGAARQKLADFVEATQAAPQLA